MDRQAFEQSDWARDAVERCIERVCEAASRLDHRAEELMPGQPWGDVFEIGERVRSEMQLTGHRRRAGRRAAP